MLLVLLVWLPLPLGSNRPWSWALMATAAFALLGLWLLRYALRPASLPAAAREARIPLALLGLWLLYLLAQALPAGDLAPAAPGAGVDSFQTGALSVDPGATLIELQKSAAYVAIFWLVLVLTTSRRRLGALCWALVLVGVAESLVGISVHLIGLREHRTPIGMFDLGGVVGTYVNRNHFAGLLAMAIAVGLGLYLASTRRPEPVPGRRARLRRAASAMLGVRGMLVACLTFMTSALLLSASRGGVAALALGLLAVTLLSTGHPGLAPLRPRLLTVAAALVVLSLAWLGPGKLETKLAQYGVESNRADIRDATYGMVRDRWVFGSGAGTYRWAFPAYKHERLGPEYYEHAHNDYLEVLATQGVVGFSLFYGAVLLVVARLVRGFFRRRHPYMRGVLLGVLAGSVAFLGHGFVDFNLQIPANAAWFTVLLALGLVACTIEHSQPGGAAKPDS